MRFYTEFFICMNSFVYLFLLFRAAPLAYRNSQARGGIWAVAVSLHPCHSNARSEPCLDLHHSWQQCQIFNALSEARDRTCVLMYTRQVHNLLSHNGNSYVYEFKCAFLSLLLQFFESKWHGNLRAPKLRDWASVPSSVLHILHLIPPQVKWINNTRIWPTSTSDISLQVDP